MKPDLTDVLDTAIERLLAGEPLTAILADYPAQTEVLASLMNASARLEMLHPVEMPPSEVLQADRSEFLAQVATLSPQAVSPGWLERLKGWIVHSLPWLSFNLIYQRKEQWRMSTLLVKAVIIFSLAFGSLGGTAVMAASSLPGSPVYPVKLTMEQTRLALTSGPVDQAKLHLTLAQVRTQEMTQLALDGDIPDEAAQARLQQHLQQAFNLAAQAPEQEMSGLLNQAQQMLQTQAQQLAKMQSQVGEAAGQALQQANGLVNQARQNAEAGLQDPQAFRWQYTHGGRAEDTLLPPDQSAPGEPGGNPDCPNNDCEPVGDQYQHGPRPERPGPGQPNGNPDCPDGDCEPVGDQYQHQYGSNSDQLGQHGEPCQTDNCEPVGDANHYGRDSDSLPGPHGDCDSGDCEPVGDQHHYGHEPDYGPGTGMPGGNPDCPDGDCEPVGDQHQHGPQPEHPGPGQPGGNPDCPDGDCEPVGDQNQNGQDSASQSSDGESDSQDLHHGQSSSGSAGGQDGGSDDSGGSSDNGGDDSGSSDSGGGDSGSSDKGGDKGGGHGGKH